MGEILPCCSIRGKFKVRGRVSFTPANSPYLIEVTFMALVVDMPLYPIEVPEENRCVQVTVSGERCAHEAVRSGRCDVHHEWVRCAMSSVGMALPEDSI